MLLMNEEQIQETKAEGSTSSSIRVRAHLTDWINRGTISMKEAAVAASDGVEPSSTMELK